MVVQHNLQAMNANRMLGITQGTIAGSTEKLSSGYQINRAADNAAGLSISEKMRKQIRGLDQASTNAEDGISCVQTAEGALQEVQDMLQRMNELCVQAANGTNSKTDRQYIQDEIDQLVEEIDRVAETSKFNEMYLLKGDKANGTTSSYITNYSVTLALNTAKTNAQTDGTKYKVNYRGINNIYMVSTSILSSNSSQHLTADKIATGDEITKYMAEDTTAGNLANATLSDKYQVFVNVELNSKVLTGSGGMVASATYANGNIKGMTATDGGARANLYKYDLSTDGTTSIVRANRDLYVYDTKQETITRIRRGDEMTEYISADTNVMNDRYRLVDILFGDPVTNSEDTVSSTHTTNLQAPSIEQGTQKHTSTRVAESVLGGVDNSFSWSNKMIEPATGQNQLYDADGQVVSGMRLNEFFDENGKYMGGLFTTSQARAIDQVFADDTSAEFKRIQDILTKKAIEDGDMDEKATSAATIGKYITQSAKQVANAMTFDLHVGADSNKENKVTTTIQSITSAGLGINKLASWNVGIVDTTGLNATAAIDVVASALQMVSTQRSALGAVQNRLEHTIKNLDNIVENTTAAESRIRDTDMAEEMVKYSNNNVLQQAGQSMLAQSNQANQGVLSLLQ